MYEGSPSPIVKLHLKWCTCERWRGEKGRREGSSNEKKNSGQQRTAQQQQHSAKTHKERMNKVDDTIEHREQKSQQNDDR